MAAGVTDGTFFAAARVKAECYLSILTEEEARRQAEAAAAAAEVQRERQASKEVKAAARRAVKATTEVAASARRAAVGVAPIVVEPSSPASPRSSTQPSPGLPKLRGETQQAAVGRIATNTQPPAGEVNYYILYYARVLSSSFLWYVMLCYVMVPLSYTPASG
ncbi:hypothetical protein T492DRAFT_279041 [Pavlovales sp. CCMP2436]|nr:hypothetical protein T492DRAFT_279041 [Pavlovales sp. CCMP2436]